MDLRTFQQVRKSLRAGQTVMVQVKSYSSYSGWSKYGGSTLQAVRCTEKGRISCNVGGRTVAIPYRNLILLEGELPLTQVVVRPDPEPVPPAVKKARGMDEKELVRLIMEAVGESDWTAEELISKTLLPYMTKSQLRQVVVNHCSYLLEDE